MKKAEGIRWSSLEAEDEIKPAPFPTNGKKEVLIHWISYRALVVER